MILNSSKTIRMLYPYCAQDTIMEMHSRDMVVLFGYISSFVAVLHGKFYIGDCYIVLKVCVHA